MLDVLEKIVVGLFILLVIAWFAGYGVIFYKAATGDVEFFAKKGLHREPRFLHG